MASGCFSSTCLLVACLAFLSISNPFASADTFQQEFVVTWGFDHVTTSSDGRALWLMLDNSSGSSFASKKSYLFGSVSMQMKLVPGDSAGVVTAYYMASPDPSVRDELDFEFLGNTSGQPYILQTNVFAHGIGGREQRIYLWFDPTEDFHAYSFLWNHDLVMFLVDDVPVRVFLNNEKQGVAFLNNQPMGVFSSIWNGDQWATQGGLIKTNWSHAPFITSYQSFNADACESTGGERPSCALPNSQNWWNKPPYTTVSPRQVAYLQWVKQNFMVYDYCTDSARYQPAPKECSINP